MLTAFTVVSFCIPSYADASYEQYIDTNSFAGMGGYAPRFFYDCNVDLSYEDTSSGEYSFMSLVTYPYKNTLSSGFPSTSVIYPFGDNSEHGFYQPTDFVCNLVNFEGIYFSLDVAENIERSSSLVMDSETIPDSLYGFSAGCSLTLMDSNFKGIIPNIVYSRIQPVIEFTVEYRVSTADTWHRLTFDTSTSFYCVISEYYLENNGYCVDFNVSFNFTPDLAELGRDVRLIDFTIFPFESGSFGSSNRNINFIFLNRVDIFANWTYKPNPFIPQHKFDDIRDYFVYEEELNDNIPDINPSSIEDVLDTNAFMRYASVIRQPLETPVISSILVISITFMIAGFLIYGKRVK